ncbi:hypothetical protein HPB49_008219 [Dermacentor silvarum]|uniref:Uncharacterized protein n=1 Tax=Dermacentor silvarum TaxID=543639 RepID=A0ACB8CDX6_DERSI|nr:hypothetical protein HPB49_008219 [Dermacentor silvarum]
MGVLQLGVAIHRNHRCVNLLPFKRVQAGRRLAVLPSFLPSVPFLKFRFTHVVVLDMGYEVSELGFHLINLVCMCHGVAECRELVADLVRSAILLIQIGILILLKGRAALKPRERQEPECLQDPALGGHDFITFEDTTLHYVSAGNQDKPLVLLLHGFPDFWFFWKHQILDLKKDFWVVALHLRGYGRSSKPNLVFDYRGPRLVEDVRGLIVSLGKKKASIVGHDWGAVIAWWVATKYENLVDKMVIINEPYPLALRYQLEHSLSQMLMSWYFVAFQLPWLPEASFCVNDLQLLDTLHGAYDEEEREALKYAFSKPVRSAILLIQIGILILLKGRAALKPRERQEPECLQDPALGGHDFITFEEATLHYVSAGNQDKPLVLVLTWIPRLLVLLEAPDPGFKEGFLVSATWVVALDLRGYGRSSKPTLVFDYRGPRLVEDVRGLIVSLGEQPSYSNGMLISRTATKHTGMKEDTLKRFVQAITISRILYVTSFLCLSKAEKHRINIIITKAYKQSLHFPQSTANQKLIELGVHNTIDELNEAQRLAHYEGLSQTKTGCHIIRTLDIQYLAEKGAKVPIAPDLTDMLLIMHPGYNAGRRADRARSTTQQALLETHPCKKKAIIVGHDWGAVIAWWLATKYENLVDKLVIINGPHPLALRYQLEHSLSQMLMSWYFVAFQLPWLPESSFCANDLQLLDTLHGAYDEEEREALKYTFSKPGAFTGPVNYYRASFRRQSEDPFAYRQLYVPALIVWGCQDTALTNNIAALSLQYAGGGRVEYVANAGHWVHRERPKLVNDLIRRFLLDETNMRSQFKYSLN